LGDVLKLTPHESVELISATAECLEVKVTYTAGDSPPKHLHPEQDEEFEVLAGTLVADVDGTKRELGPGEKLEIQRGSVHRMWNPGPEPTVVTWRTLPAGRTEHWFRAIDALHREGRVGKDGMPGPLAFGVMLTEYRDVFRLAGPDPLLRPALALLGLAGRARGYSPI
jgi:quercetin dioxygenase-like cupin family protein